MKKSHIRFFLLILVICSLAPTAVAIDSHLGQDPNHHVVLVSDYLPEGEYCQCLSFEKKAFFRVHPDGSVDSNWFSVPEGFLLVVTDVEWNILDNKLVPESSLMLRISIGNSGFPGNDPYVFQSIVIVDEAAARGRPGANDYTTAGFVVAPDTKLCPTLCTIQEGGGTMIAAAKIEIMILRGYLIPSNP